MVKMDGYLMTRLIKSSKAANVDVGNFGNLGSVGNAGIWGSVNVGGGGGGGGPENNILHTLATYALTLPPRTPRLAIALAATSLARPPEIRRMLASSMPSTTTTNSGCLARTDDNAASNLSTCLPVCQYFWAIVATAVSDPFAAFRPPRFAPIFESG